MSDEVEKRIAVIWDADPVVPYHIFIKIAKEVYSLGKEDAQKELKAKAENWCRSDSESSFHPNISSWRLFDYLFPTEAK